MAEMSDWRSLLVDFLNSGACGKLVLPIHLAASGVNPTPEQLRALDDVPGAKAIVETAIGPYYITLVRTEADDHGDDEAYKFHWVGGPGGTGGQWTVWQSAPGQWFTE